MVWKDQLYLGKTPDRVITINRNYYAILADLVADGDTNDLTNGAWEVLHYLGLAEAEMFGIEDHRMAGWRNRGNELLSALVIEHARARSTGRRSTAKEPG